MVRMFLAAAVAALLMVGEASANGPGGPAGPTVERYGWNPVFKGLFGKKKAGDCSTGNCAVAPPPYGATPPMPGTLVFPNHQFTRSPRDFFMWEK